MIFLLTLVCTGVIVALLQKPIKRWPVVFYVLALAGTCYYLYATQFGAPAFIWKYGLIFFQRCIIAMALFTLVMFVSVFPNDSKFRALFGPLRRELSILAFIFASGHIVGYLESFVPQLATNASAMNTNLVFSLAVSCIITLLLVALTVTSVNAVHKRMSAKTWKRIQMLAYPFYVLIFVHLFIVLFPSALAGSETIVVNFFVYAVLLTLYVVFRIGKAVLDRHEEAAITAISRSTS